VPDLIQLMRRISVATIRSRAPRPHRPGSRSWTHGPSRETFPSCLSRPVTGEARRSPGVCVRSWHLATERREPVRTSLYDAPFSATTFGGSEFQVGPMIHSRGRHRQTIWPYRDTNIATSRPPGRPASSRQSPWRTRPAGPFPLIRCPQLAGVFLRRSVRRALMVS
jgi:hypothetical protein